MSLIIEFVLLSKINAFYRCDKNIFDFLQTIEYVTTL